ncbi:hypothetical protein [Gloeocapsopsis dulcis]|uniref:Beta-propeller repeat protein n=1 Tax=Gloeocapsopsis dulcis AAB1 = 1H9 TaxID=1433147 RepID=A0A6N8FRK8_9CHRO|nr:hypothetical protein [Gloeocapsopsis dulcis]MUL34975.1 hypothetical protein [Gloeocapsopsis dulcis AAB1 = 1H9]WNN89952.1 hypothetical protein P0S91_02300 [Gloeocapsopsis dulcis]
MALDKFGNVYVTGTSFGASTNRDYATVKYDTNGKQLWVRRYNGPVNGDDDRVNLAIRFGNVYVTGSSVGSGTKEDYATIKYSR